MRKVSGSYSVSYDLFNKNNDKIVSKIKTPCFGALFRYFKRDDVEHEIKFDDYLILKDFLAEETQEFAYKYIEKLCKIFNFKYNYIKENEVKITNFDKNNNVKIFVTLYRILFENCYSDQRSKNVNYIFIKSFILNEYKIKDLVERLIHCHNKSGLFLGCGHCIKSSNYQIKLKNKKQLLEYKPNNYSPVQGFFTKEE